MKVVLKHITGQIAVFEVANKKLISVSVITLGIPTVSTLDNLKFSREGILNIYPDLAGKLFTEQKAEAIKRFKEKLLELKNDEQCSMFIANDMKEHGYTPVSLERKGFRSKGL